MASKRKKRDNSGLGRNLIKERNRSSKRSEESWRHTSELDDGYDWGRLNLRSVTEESTLDDFLRTAQLAGTEFLAEKMNIKVVQPNMGGLPSQAEKEKIQKAQEENRQFLGIPRKPRWDQSTTHEQLDLMERDSFLAWRRNLAKLQENEQLILTPYERNLEFWRQLWRVVEMSHIVVQIVDARNPLLFRCEDLEEYTKELNPSKVNVLLVNKSDHLTEEQRRCWSEYFTSISLAHAFWSATEEKKEAEVEGELPGDSSTLSEERDPHEPIVEDSDEEELMDSSQFESDRIEALNRFDILGAEEGGNSSDGGNDEEMHPSSTAEDLMEKIVIPNDIVKNENSCTTRQRDEVELPDQEVESDEGSLELVGTTERTVSIAQQSGDIGQQSVHVAQQSGDIGQHFVHVAQQESLNSPSCSTEVERETVGSECDIIKNIKPVADDVTQMVTNSAALRLDGDKRTPSRAISSACLANSAKILSRQELLDFFRHLHPIPNGGRLHVGLVGYPNVGKSSTINVLYQQKKTPVSATPGRTKHVQTLLIEDDICLCDCPGLVFPTFVNTKAEMVCNGILPIDQLRDPIPPIAMVCQHIPRHVLRTIYGIYLPPPTDEWVDPNAPPTPRELLAAYARERGFMGSKGNPDLHRASRYILKDYTNGKLLYCYPPPGVNPEQFNPHLSTPPTSAIQSSQVKSDPILASTINVKTKLSKDGREHSQQDTVAVGSKGVHGVKGFTRKEGFVHHQGNIEPGIPPNEIDAGSLSSEPSDLSSLGPVQKPWKKHHNRNKKEKIRRLK